MHTFRIGQKRAAREIAKLTPRQYVVVYLLARGRTYKQIARALNIHKRTVYTHACRARDCVGAETVTQTVALMVRSKTDV
jgi:DNA-binding CsgD family transcriptional regulator